MINLSDYYKSNYSQFGQDGIIEKLIELTNIQSKYFVEFGSNGNDNGGGNTPNLRKHGWDGLLLDIAVNPDVTIYPIHQEKITADNIEFLFEKYDVPKEFGFLSIDIDGQDYWVWQAIKNWNAGIVCIESNHYAGRERSISTPKNNDFIMNTSYYFGASQKALLELGLTKGYSLVAICVTDMIFIKTKLIELLIKYYHGAFYGMNDIEVLDTANTQSWVNIPIKEEIKKYEWVEV